MFTADIDSGNILPYVYVVNIDWPGRQRNPRWGTVPPAQTRGGTHVPHHSLPPAPSALASAVLLIGLAASGGTAQSQSTRFDRTNDLTARTLPGLPASTPQDATCLARRRRGWGSRPADPSARARRPGHRRPEPYVGGRGQCLRLWGGSAAGVRRRGARHDRLAGKARDPHWCGLYGLPERRAH